MTMNAVPSASLFRPRRVAALPMVAGVLSILAALTGCDARDAQKRADAEKAKMAATRQQLQSKAAESAPAKRIAVVPKGTTHEYWKSIHAGALKAQRELGNVTITFRGPEKEDDREQQVALMENLISAKFDAIVLAPLDDRALLLPVQQAAAAKIPIIIMDSGLQGQVGKDFMSFVATDNEKGGALAAARISELLKPSTTSKPKVLILRYVEGSASTALREKGFVETISKDPALTLIDPRRYGGVTRATAQEAAENLLAAHPDIAAVFCPNESTTFGMMLALRSRGMSGKVTFIGFDSSPELVDAMAKGDIQGLVVQNPIRMGYLAVAAAVDALAGKPVEPRIDTGVALITKDTMNTPEAKDLLSPDLKSLLNEAGK
jgi:ribose transport system substrate-binding protein